MNSHGVYCGSSLLTNTKKYEKVIQVCHIGNHICITDDIHVIDNPISCITVWWGIQESFTISCTLNAHVNIWEYCVGDDIP